MSKISSTPKNENVPTNFELELSITRYGIYPGGTPATQPLALLLREGLADEAFGRGFDCVKLDLHFKHEGRPPPPFNAADIKRYHQYLATFPKITARRKARRIEIRWSMSLSLAPFAPGCAPTVSGFEQLSGEALRALDAARPRLTKVPDLDFVALMSRVKSAIASMPRSPDAFLARIAELKAATSARAEARCAADPWSVLALDWSEYHPSARKLLDEPFFWDPADDHAPVGNDTGADVLEHYRASRRKQKNRGAGALPLVERLLDEWGMTEAGNTDAHLVRDEAFIAVAFAQAMLDGAVAQAVAARAVAAIDRQLARHSAWPDPGARRATLEKMRSKLVALA